MTEIRSEENAIIYYSAKKLVDVGVSASKLLVNGKEAKTLIENGKKVLTLLKAYKRKDELSDAELDAILYCLRGLSGQTDFPTMSPLVGKDISAAIKLFSLITFFDEGVLIGDEITEIDFVGASVSATKSGNRLTVTITGGGGAASAGTWVSQGNWDGSTNVLPLVGRLGDSIKEGYTWENTANTTTLLGPDGGIIAAGMTIRAKVDNPGTNINNWRVHT